VKLGGVAESGLMHPVANRTGLKQVPRVQISAPPLFLSVRTSGTVPAVGGKQTELAQQQETCCNWKVGRVVDGVCLENRRAERSQGFESLTFLKCFLGYVMVVHCSVIGDLCDLVVARESSSFVALVMVD
jgi:hypothetical protein